MNPKPQNKEGKAHRGRNGKSQRGLSSCSSSQGLEGAPGQSLGGGGGTQPTQAALFSHSFLHEEI